jgi:hypothetical protein
LGGGNKKKRKEGIGLTFAINGKYGNM